MTDTYARRGRPPGTTRRELEVIAMRLFNEQGFDETTVDQLARLWGFGRLHRLHRDYYERTYGATPEATLRS